MKGDLGFKCEVITQRNEMKKEMKCTAARTVFLTHQW